MIASIGRIVLVRFPAGTTYNGSDTHPAIITAVHSETMINARVFVDGDDAPIWETSIPERGTVAAEGYGGPVWFWPPRVEA